MIGKEILNYTIVSVIGKGGMGSVYLAEHKYIKLQKAAIKVINGGMVNNFTRQRLAEEAEHLARLSHNNIVRFLNYHIDQSDSVYLIMEYAQGVTLDKYINEKSGLIVEDRICSFFEPILEAVGYAHKKEVIHRDLKPSNIIITEEGSAKILDFGIARIMDKEGDNSNDEKLIMGTPAYMSPEQVKGEALDARSDIYSLGVLLYQMLTGNAPYDTTTLSEFDINQKVVEEPLPKMSSYYKYISEKLQKIVDKATAKQPKDRYQSCADFKKALHAAIYPPKVATWVTYAATACILLLVGGAGYLWDYNRLKTYYYKDYVEQWGIPQGIGPIDAKTKLASHRMYRFEYQQRKLQRVSHVNSLGIVIEDGESERNERPLDMLFSYAPNGNVSKVKVRDNAQKVLYIKAYNDRLNTLIFQYDDEYGTEKTLATQTIGYVNSMTDTGTKGRISRWLLTYDANGYVTTIHYAAFQNVRVGDANNIYGRKYVRDNQGRVIEELYLGKNSEPKTTNWGLGMKKFRYDERDHFVESKYYTADGKPALDQVDGTNAMTKEYDAYGNAIAEYYHDHEGNLMLPKLLLIAGYRHQFDSSGFLIQTTTIGIDKQPCYNQSGYATLKSTNNEYGHPSKVAYYDIDNNPCYSTSGLAYWEQTTNPSGRVTKSWNYDIEGKLTENYRGIAGFEAAYDTLGNLTKMINYGVDQKPTENADGVYGYEWEYNQLGLLTKTKNLGKELNYAADKYGAIIIARTYDNAQNCISSQNETADGKPLLMHTNYCGRSYKYDENGNQIEESFYNEKNQPCKGPDGFVTVKQTYDSNGFLTSYKFYDLAGALTLHKGEAGRVYTNDERGNVVTEMPLDTEEKQSKGLYEIRRTFDESDNILTIAYFDQGVPTKNGFHKVENSYNSRNQQVSTTYYDVNGKLTKKDGDTYAIETLEYDEKGNHIKSSFFGVDQQPIDCAQGYASVVSDLNVMGQTVRNTFYGTNGLPATTAACIPIIEYQYDKWNNTIYYATKDGTGKLYQLKKYGFAIYRQSFDARGNTLSESYFDHNDHAIIHQDEGYHLLKNEYDKQGNRISSSYFGTQKEPIVNEKNKYHKCQFAYDKRNNWLSTSYFNTAGESMLVDGYAKRVNSFNQENKMTEYQFYDQTGQPVNSTYGYQKVTMEYKSNGDNEKLKTYTTAGKLVTTYTWDGSEWKVVLNWKSSLQNTQANTPYNYGDEYGNVVMKSAKATGDRHCTLTFYIPYSIYSISESDLAYYKEFVVNVGQSFAEEPEFRSANVRVTVRLYDQVDREIHTATL